MSSTPTPLAIWDRHALQDLATLREALAADADPNTPSATGDLPLHAAVAQGDAETVELLIVIGADVRRRDAQGRTVLHRCPADRADLAMRLIDAGAAITARLPGDDRDAIAHFPAAVQRQLEVRSYLRLPRRNRP